MDGRLDPEKLARFLTENIVPRDAFPAVEPPKFTLEEAVQRIQSAVHYATFHDDSDEAIRLWHFWHTVRLAIGCDVQGRKSHTWTDEVYE